MLDSSGIRFAGTPAKKLVRNPDGTASYQDDFTYCQDQELKNQMLLFLSQGQFLQLLGSGVESPRIYPWDVEPQAFHRKSAFQG